MQSSLNHPTCLRAKGCRPQLRKLDIQWGVPGGQGWRLSVFSNCRSGGQTGIRAVPAGGVRAGTAVLTAESTGRPAGGAPGFTFGRNLFLADGISLTGEGRW